MAEYKKQKKMEQKKRKLAEMEEGTDSDIAAVMGFGGFSTSKK